MVLAGGACWFASSLFGYKTIALLLLMLVSVLAMLFEILPVLTAAILGAFIWNFFFIPPVFTLHISNTEDLLLFLLYFLIASVNAVLSYLIKQEEYKVRDKAEKERAIVLYNTLLNSLSHELRTPISTIIGSVDALIENREKLSIENQTALLEQISIAGQRLNRQVENLLNMSRLETGMLKPVSDWFDINEIMQSIISKLNYSKDHHISFTPNEQLPLIKIDSGLVEQIVQNLLHNAILYTPPSSTIKLTASYYNKHCIITIEDSGKGISEQEWELVFEKFYRSQHTIPGGSGLGLSIVKGFIEAMNGRVEIGVSGLGGAKFTLYIPVEISFLNQLKNE